MPTFFFISRHSPENCPAFNEKAKKVTLAYMVKMDAWAKKYEVKVLAGCSVPNEHIAIMICEALSMEAVQKMSMVPEVMEMNAFSTTEVKLAINMEEAMKQMHQIK